jgi:hypothetical protein
MFGGGAMGARRQLVPLGGFPVCVLHGVSSSWKRNRLSSNVHGADQLLPDRDIPLAMAPDRRNLPSDVLELQRSSGNKIDQIRSCDLTWSVPHPIAQL